MQISFLDVLRKLCRYLQRRGYIIPPCAPKTLVENAEKVMQAEDDKNPLPALKWS